MLFSKIKPYLSNIQQPIFHGTDNIDSILTQGIKAPHEKANNISFSRSLDFYSPHNKGITTVWTKSRFILVLDARELRNRLKLEPYNYFSEEHYGIPVSTARGKRRFEYETRAVGGKQLLVVPPKYIRAVIVNLDNYQLDELVVPEYKALYYKKGVVYPNYISALKAERQGALKALENRVLEPLEPTNLGYDCTGLTLKDMTRIEEQYESYNGFAEAWVERGMLVIDY